jgi:hypothetical protein
MTIGVSLNFRTQAWAQETGVVVICLLTITHDDLDEPILLSTDPTQRLYEYGADQVYGTVSRGDDYVFFPMSLKLPDDTDDGPRSMTIEIDNVGREYMETLRSISGQPKVNTEIVLSNDLDTVEAAWPEFLITHISANAGTVTMPLTMETLNNEPFPSMSFTPGSAPGLFRRL